MGKSPSAEFVTVATVDELQPGERMVVEVGRRWVAIFNVDGTYYAIEDVCTHDDGPSEVQRWRWRCLPSRWV